MWKKRRIAHFLVLGMFLFFSALASIPNLYYFYTVMKNLKVFGRSRAMSDVTCQDVHQGPSWLLYFEASGFIDPGLTFNKTRCIKKHRLLQYSKASTRLSHRGHETLSCSEMARNQLRPGQRRDSLLWGYLGVKTGGCTFHLFHLHRWMINGDYIPDIMVINAYLVGGLEHFLFSHILGIIIPID